MRTVLLLVVVAVSFAGLAGCGVLDPHCVQGQSTACTCTDGKAGSQLCNARGTYDLCVCSGGSGTGGGNAGTGGGTGTGGGAATGGGSGSGPKRVFVSSIAYTSTAAPTVCQSLADSQSLGGQWVAWLSGGGTSAISKITGIGPWKLLDGTQIFANRGQLAVAPSAPIKITETGATLSSTTSQRVWTGTFNGGTPSTNTCSDWSSVSGSIYGTVGNANSTASWTDNGTDYCYDSARVYCFEL